MSLANNTMRDMVQLIIYGLVAGANVIPMALGFLLFWRVVGFFNFALSAMVCIAPYIVFLCLPVASLTSAILFGLIGSSATGLISYITIFRPLIRRRGTPSVLLLASLGLSLVTQTGIAMAFGHAIRSFRTWPDESSVSLGLIAVSPAQFAILLVGTVLVCLTGWVERRTSFGRQMRAMSSNAELSEYRGVAVERIRLQTVFIASALVGLAGILIAADVDMSPAMGFEPFMMGTVAALLGGGTASGAIAGAFIVSLVAHSSGLVLPASWQNTAVFLLLLALIAFRPQGLRLPDQERAST